MALPPPLVDDRSGTRAAKRVLEHRASGYGPAMGVAGEGVTAIVLALTIDAFGGSNRIPATSGTNHGTSRRLVWSRKEGP